MSLASDEGAIFSSTSWMEEPLHFDLEQTNNPSQLHIPTVNVRCFSKGLEVIDGTTPANHALIENKGAGFKNHCAHLLKTDDDDDDLFGFNESDDMDDASLSTRWEDELAQIVGTPSDDLDQDDFESDLLRESSLDPKRDREVPLLDENTQEMLVALPVKDFNIRTKSLKLDNRVLSHLKLLRKRLKNRQAAIRSRSKKENETIFLQKRVNELVRERDQQGLLIRQLQLRLTEVEKKMKSS